MFKFITKLFSALTRAANILDLLAKEGETTVKDWAVENAAVRKQRLEAINRGEDPDADD